MVQHPCIGLFFFPVTNRHPFRSLPHLLSPLRTYAHFYDQTQLEKNTNLAALLKWWIEKTLRGTNDPSISHQRGSWENQRLKEVPLGREMWSFPEGYNAYKSDKSLWAGSAALHHLGVHPDSSLNSSTDPLHSLELTTRTWKSMVGKRKFLFEITHFQRLWLLVLGSNKSNRSLFSVSQNVEKKPSIFIAPNFV